jgi:DNA segregation ATPase FtsK/SpoIIIE, S-DNA-T family
MAEIERRHTSAGDEGPRFLFIFDLPRLRELRRQEEDFSFSRSSEEAPRRPDQQFADILRDGAAVGVHVVVWCDSLTNFQRMLERQGLKEFDTRILLQMSPADSSLLMDTPAASLLGRHRALLHREDEGRLEKFRPYAPPSEAWLVKAAGELAGRASLAP